MNAKTDMKLSIQEALNNFQTRPFVDAAYDFWKVLGYESQRRFEEVSYTYSEFTEAFSSRHQLRPVQALKERWTKINLHFQLTNDEIREAGSFSVQTTIPGFKSNSVDSNEVKSYIFASIELKGLHATRKELVALTREINRCFAMPVLLLIKYGELLTISVINRRLNKRDETRDVLDKVSLVKDIRYATPHRGHIDILEKFCLGNLDVSSINQLHKAWQKQLSIRELNREFYNQIIAWYRTSLSIIRLKFQCQLSEEEQNETKKHFLVKLLCRLMFCWFLKEKGLIDSSILELFSDTDVPYPIVKDNDNPESNSYYRGILQTVFFDCLNEPKKSRKLDKGKIEKYLDPALDLTVFERIPFLNGGVFNRDDEFLEDHCILNNNIADSDISIPNKIFYGWQAPGNRRSDDVPGLNVILGKFKFTIEENTPLEEDVALDPELLGMVFENLLAELDPDPDISRNARRSSGAYYTPREVIDYMVNDSLVLYLESKAKEKGLMEYGDNIRFLVYHDVVNANEKRFDDFVVDALDKIRILDPACGSGSFPMGMLHKITRILNLVDPDNSKWLHLKLEPLEGKYRDDFGKHLKEHYDDYSRKIGILRDSIFGVDIQPLAVHIAKLRFFISLVVDQNTDCSKDIGVMPLPNLETNLICADSLNDIETDIFEEIVSNDLSRAIEEYYQAEHTKAEKEQLAERISTELSNLYQSFKWGLKNPSKDRLKVFWKRWFMYGNIACPFFHPECFFPRVMKEGGFDIVIGNPPYGGDKISPEVRSSLGLGSNDPYGAFIARFMNFNDFPTPLKPHGVLSYIVSDTFMTIKSHKKLRRQLLDNYIHKIIRMHPDTFKQVVNTVVILCQKAEPGYSIPDSHQCLMVDMTNISIHKYLDKFLEILYDISDAEKAVEYSDNVHAVFIYHQNIIHKCSLLPFFVAPPKLFSLMHDVGVDRNPKNKAERTVEINGKKVTLVKLSDIASVTQGLATGDNKSYLFQTPESGPTYRSIEPYLKYVVSDAELEKISQNDNIRHKIINLGFHQSRSEQPFDPDRWFGGKYIVPYDKGGASYTESGWLPNYYVKTDFFIDWSSWAVTRMKTLTIRERDGKGSNAICSRFQNSDTYFSNGITFSIVGQYAPTFRYNSSSVYDIRGSLINVTTPYLQIDNILSILCSKLCKFIFKALIYHGVAAEIDAIKEIPIICGNNDKIISLVRKIITKQISDRYYDYSSNEQRQIDKIIYELYGLCDQDIELVEQWYARRYPRLVNNALLDDQESL